MTNRLHLGFLYAPNAVSQAHDAGFDPLDPAQLVTLAQKAEAAGFTFLAIDDSLGAVPDVAGASRTEAFTTASFLATNTRRLGLLATANTSYAEPYNLARLAASLDHVTHGRAGWTVATGAGDPADANHSRKAETAHAHYERATEALSIARKLWDSWEDDAFVRDKQTGVFVDGDKIHAIDHRGPLFDVKGPLNVARPPQGQVVVAHHVVDRLSALFAATTADIAFIRAADPDKAIVLREEIVSAAAASGRNPLSLVLIVEISPVVAPSETAARRLAGELPVGAGIRLVGNPRDVADRIGALADVGLDGVVVAPPVITSQFDAFADLVVPELTRRGRVRDYPEEASLRERLGLPRPANIFERGSAPRADAA